MVTESYGTSLEDQCGDLLRVGSGLDQITRRIRFSSAFFWLTYSCLALWLRFGIRVLQNSLRRHPLARISAPTVEEVEEYQRIVGTICPRLGDVWATCDGLNLCFERSISQWIQWMFYIRWLHGHFISNVFVFAVDGTIRICGLNAPGSMHDSTIADLLQ